VLLYNLLVFDGISYINRCVIWIINGGRIQVDAIGRRIFVVVVVVGLVILSSGRFCCRVLSCGRLFCCRRADWSIAGFQSLRFIYSKAAVLWISERDLARTCHTDKYDTHGHGFTSINPCYNRWWWWKRRSRRHVCKAISNGCEHGRNIEACTPRYFIFLMLKIKKIRHASTWNFR
jgi:hypothetical protein